MSENRFLTRLEAGVASLLRLPAAGPEPPSGSGQVRLFRAAPAYFVYNLVRWGVSQAGALAGLVIGLGFIAALPPQLWPLRYLEVLGVAAFLAQLPFSLAVVWIDYRRRWYLVTDRSLRIREGVWTLHERTMSFANVQNLEIRQGPIHRLLGLAALEVRSAGGGQAGPSTAQGSGARQNLHVAHFRGVDNAEEIRDLILARLRRLRDAGLGDLDEEEGDLAAAAPAPATPLSAMPPAAMPPAAPPIAASSPAVAAAHELLAEARALRMLFP